MHHVSKISEHIYHSLLLLLTALKLLVIFGNIAQENATADILIEYQRHSPLDIITVDQEPRTTQTNS